jgi:O-acetyl-ADP-ribose deacetylase (regulator of RNase III)
MTIHLKRGDLLAQENVDAIVNTVNCVGVMGMGIALQFKNKWPENFKAYKAACDRGEVRLGRMFVYDSGGLLKPNFIQAAWSRLRDQSWLQDTSHIN